MKFLETELKGAYVIELDRREDERGFFARTFCKNIFDEQGLPGEVVQTNISYNARRGTLRGMHYQAAPFAEAKLVQCVQGSLYDVIIDLRSDSETYCQWIGVELSAAKGRMLYVPEGFAHGFQTLEDNTAVYYHMFQYFAPYLARGVRWDDPAFGIKWPLEDPIISEKDRQLPDYER